MTVQQIADAHAQALAQLTPAQQHALSRERRARQIALFNGRDWLEALQQLFAREAADATAEISAVAA